MTSISPIPDSPTLAEGPPSFSLAHLPPTHLLPTRLEDTTLHALEQSLLAHQCPLTYSLSEARLFIADINTPRRCELELKSRAIYSRQLSPGERQAAQNDDDTFSIIKLKWLTDSLEQGKELDIAPYVVYKAIRTPKPHTESTYADAEPAAKRVKLNTQDSSAAAAAAAAARERQREGILARAKRDGAEWDNAKRASASGSFFRGRFVRRGQGDVHRISHQPAPVVPAVLLRKTTTEWEEEQELAHTRPVPEYVAKKVNFLFFIFKNKTPPTPQTPTKPSL